MPWWLTTWLIETNRIHKTSGGKTSLWLHQGKFSFPKIWHIRCVQQVACRYAHSPAVKDRVKLGPLCDACQWINPIVAGEKRCPAQNYIHTYIVEHHLPWNVFLTGLSADMSETWTVAVRWNWKNMLFWMLWPPPLFSLAFNNQLSEAFHCFSSVQCPSRVLLHLILVANLVIRFPGAFLTSWWHYKKVPPAIKKSVGWF